MSGHDLVSVMTSDGGLGRRFVCSCGESGSLVPNEDAAKVEHERHASARVRIARPPQAQSPVLGRLGVGPATPLCHAGRDGDCVWSECPQKVNYQGHCPLDNLCPECFGEESSPSCRCAGSGFVALASDEPPT